MDTGKGAAIAYLCPSVPGQDFGSGEDIYTVILTTWFPGSIDRINEFPCFVFIAIPVVGRETLSVERYRERSVNTPAPRRMSTWPWVSTPASDP
ncbi:hypothetical protein [Amycolatopsis taiwanensis]|uniref:hypothetical protein n=1 Tax=Amycolatopsis taiwanensis TaxID=342230 RepID=UPI0012EB5B5B|nr:hypothetical protein [Amycolatopsis taiwanensis]